MTFFVCRVCLRMLAYAVEYSFVVDLAPDLPITAPKKANGAAAAVH